MKLNEDEEEESKHFSEFTKVLNFIVDLHYNFI